MKKLTFKDFDKFQRKQFADRLTTVISTFHPFYDEAFVLSLNARFGSGKTTFLKMWQSQLIDNDFSVIYINAWETDFDDEPLVPIISALLDGLNSGKGVKKLKTALRGTLGTVALASNNMLNHITGVNVNEIAKEVESDLKETDIQAIGRELYKEYSFKKKAYDALRSELSTYIENIQKKPLIIFVDELDRVRPDYSVKFLEAIKHIFSLQGVCFVLAVDRSQLESSVRQLYGNIDFENYYRKFITREAELAEVKNLDLMPFIRFQASDFLDEKRAAGVTFAFREQDQDNILQFMAAVCKAFNFAPRQIETLFRIFSQLMAVAQTDVMIRKSWVEASIILIAIFIDNRLLYNRIGAASVSPTELYDYIKKLDFRSTQRNSYERYIVLTVMSFSIKSNNEGELNEISDICLKYDSREILPENIESARSEVIRQLAKSLDDWGDIPDAPAFQKIYTLMEEWRTFIG